MVRTGMLMVAPLALALAVGGCKSDQSDEGGGRDGGADVRTPDASAAADAAGGTGDAVARDAAATGDARPADVRAGDGPPAVMCPPPPVESECDPPLEETVPLGMNRVRHCAFDIGSTNVKVIITSMVAGDRSSIEGDRVCKKAMRLRERTQDPMTMMNRPLAEADMDALVAQLRTYGEVCTKDKGMVLGAVATQWARNATNQDQIKTWFQAKMGMPLNILTGDQEGAYAYAAATHDQLDRIILDAGGGSFQVTYWVKGEPKPTAASVPFGHDASSVAVWTKPEFTGYAAARTAYIAELNKLIAARPETMQAYARLKDLVKDGKLNPDLLSLGDSGVILAVQGKLQDGAGRWVDQNTYLQRMDERRRELAMSTVMGPKKVLTLAEVDAFLEKLAANRAWFEDLRSECIRRAYGGKVLGHLTLVSHLVKEYGLGQRTVFTSGEMAEGFILEKLR